MMFKTDLCRMNFDVIDIKLFYVASFDEKLNSLWNLMLMYDY